MAQRSKAKDLVILIPGILGSRLLHQGKPFWGDDSPTFLQWVKRHGNDLAHLSIGPDDPAVDDLGDGITPSGLVESFLVVGRFVKVGGYASLARFLQKDLRLKLGENLQFFVYDWRRDLRVAARRLATRIEGWLQTWRSRSGNPEAKLVLIGHAMGGLIARYYADVEGGWPSIRKLICIGTPFSGSIRALDLLYFGLDFQAYGLPHHDLTPVVRTFTSIYELLPQYPSIRTFTGEIVSPFEIRIPTFEHHKIERARQFHRDLMDHHVRNRQAEAYRKMQCTTIAGIGQPTVEVARLMPNGMLSVEGNPAELEADGDGTVPRFSAESAGPGVFESHLYYVPQSHGALAGDPVIHSHLRDLLLEPRPGDPPPKTPLPRLTIHRVSGDHMRIEADSLALCLGRPFYKVGQKVELRAMARSASGHPFDARSLRITVRVEQISHLGKRVRPANVRMVAESGRPGWFHGHLRALAPGTYRATAAANHKLLAPFRISEFFEVDSGK
jgi:pimeloyl-ACP methyl ester carboxylesterase